LPFRVCAGSLEYYDKSFDRVNVKNERPLKRVDRVFHTVTTTDDPVIRRLAKSHPDVNVFATDAILATLMCCTRCLQIFVTCTFYVCYFNQYSFIRKVFCN
jgi:hypothetical protein